MKKPIIKANGGKPVALCNRCFCMMCYVTCFDNENLSGDSCVVIEVRYLGEEPLTLTPIGKRPPPYCNQCKKLLHYFPN